MRKKQEILDAEQEYFDRVWFERKKVMIQNIVDDVEEMPSARERAAILEAYRKVESK